MTPIGAALWWGAPHAVALVAGTDAAVAASATSYLRIITLAFPLMAVDAVYEGGLVGVQRTGSALLVNGLLNAMRIPVRRARPMT
jgi:Na+-driven multidrug efflux pump